MEPSTPNNDDLALLSDDGLSGLLNDLLWIGRVCINTDRHAQYYDRTVMYGTLQVNSEISLESSEDVGVRFWEELITTSKHLCSTHLKIKGVCSLKALKFKHLEYTGENTGTVVKHFFIVTINTYVDTCFEAEVSSYSYKRWSQYMIPYVISWSWLPMTLAALLWFWTKA